MRDRKLCGYQDLRGPTQYGNLQIPDKSKYCSASLHIIIHFADMENGSTISRQD